MLVVIVIILKLCLGALRSEGLSGLLIDFVFVVNELLAVSTTINIYTLLHLTHVIKS